MVTRVCEFVGGNVKSLCDWCMYLLRSFALLKHVAPTSHLGRRVTVISPESLRISFCRGRSLALLTCFPLHLTDDHSEARDSLRQHVLLFPLLTDQQRLTTQMQDTYSETYPNVVPERCVGVFGITGNL